jgi:hypothetical protein
LVRLKRRKKIYPECRIEPQATELRGVTDPGIFSLGGTQRNSLKKKSIFYVRPKGIITYNKVESSPFLFPSSEYYPTLSPLPPLLLTPFPLLSYLPLYFLVY